MSEIGNNHNTIPEIGTLCECLRSFDRYPLVQQREPGRRHTTARKNWYEEVNIVVMKCYYRLNPIDENE